MRTKPSLDLADATAITDGCRRAAEGLGAAVSIAVVDEAGGLLHFQRLDGARVYSVDLAIRKARTAAALAVPTRVLEERLRDRPIHGQDVLALPGGAPVMAAGQCAGAIGVSGSTAENDETIVDGGLKVLD